MEPEALNSSELSAAIVMDMRKIFSIATPEPQILNTQTASRYPTTAMGIGDKNVSSRKIEKVGTATESIQCDDASVSCDYMGNSNKGSCL